MKRNFFVVLLSMLAVATTIPHAFAADHLDGEQATADPAADITDVYAWMQNGDKINLVMDLFPLANADSRFSDGVQYVFLVNSQQTYGAKPNANRLICTFSTDQRVTCELNGEEIVTGVDASSTTGVTSTDGSFRIFTGLRNDPFFFDLNNFKVVRSTVVGAAPSLSFDEAGCPTLDAATQGVLVSALTGSGGIPGANSPAQDFFRSLNVMAIVVQADRGLFGPGPLYSVSATTHRVP